MTTTVVLRFLIGGDVKQITVEVKPVGWMSPGRYCAVAYGKDGVWLRTSDWHDTTDGAFSDMCRWCYCIAVPET